MIIIMSCVIYVYVVVCLIVLFEMAKNQQELPYSILGGGDEVYSASLLNIRKPNASKKWMMNTE
jgi:hypothetical protein